MWRAQTSRKSDVTVVTPGPGDVLRDGPPAETLWRAALVTRETGTIICEANADRTFVPEVGADMADEEILNSTDVASFNAMLPRGPVEGSGGSVAEGRPARECAGRRADHASEAGSGKLVFE